MAKFQLLLTSRQQNPSVTVSLPRGPQSTLNPAQASQQQRQQQPQPSQATSSDTGSTLPSQTPARPPSRNRPELRVRRVRNQTLVTRPAERRARDDLEAFIPARFRHPVGGGWGNANHAVFRGAVAYIRWLESQVADLGGPPEREAEPETEGRWVCQCGVATGGHGGESGG